MRDDKKSMIDIKIRKPSFFVYFIPALITRALTRFWWNHHIDKSGIKNVKSPILAIANHCSTMDIVLTIHSLLPKRFNIVTSKDLFTWGILKPFIKAFGCIPKSQNAIDLNSMRMIKAATEQGRNIIIYPEGRTSLDGKQLYYLSPTIAKFIKFVDSDVVMVKTQGAFLTKPRWYHGFRRGRVETKVYTLLTQEEVRTLSNKEIYQKVTEAMKFNDHVWQKENHIRFHHEHMANGMEYILYKCPKCGTEYEMSTDEHFITCNHCGNKVEYTEYGELLPVGESKTFDRIDLWYDYEKEEVLKEIENPDFSMSKPVVMQIEDQTKAEFFDRGEGELFIDNEYIRYKGTKDGQPFEIKQALKQLPTVITKNEEGIDLIEGEDIFRFLFTEHKYSTKYGLIVEQNYARRNNLL